MKSLIEVKTDSSNSHKLKMASKAGAADERKLQIKVNSLKR